MFHAGALFQYPKRRHTNTTGARVSQTKNWGRVVKHTEGIIHDFFKKFGPENRLFSPKRFSFSMNMGALTKRGYTLEAKTCSGFHWCLADRSMCLRTNELSGISHRACV